MCFGTNKTHLSHFWHSTVP